MVTKKLKEYARIKYQSGNTTIVQNYPDDQMFTLTTGDSDKHRTLNTSIKIVLSLYPPTDGFELKKDEDDE